jgi:5-methylcytosine-specific restriction endonuclease McrA
MTLLMPERPDARTRRIVAERANFRCEYCLTPAGIVPSPFSSEHILPRSKGGNATLENLDPATRKTVSLFHPRQQTWADHFGWAADGTRIEGRSPIGRATVSALQLNRAGWQNLRRLMVLADLHPADNSRGVSRS